MIILFRFHDKGGGFVPLRCPDDEDGDAKLVKSTISEVTRETISM